MATPIGIPGNTSIIPVNTQTISKTIILPSVQANQGRILIIKDMYGAASTQTINISTTGSDTIEKTYNNITTLSTSYGAWMFTNDGINAWFLIDNYQNTLSSLNRNTLAPFSPLAFTFSVAGSTFTTTWLPSLNATSYSVSYYYTVFPQTSGGTLIQTVSVGTALVNTITYTPQVIYYYYAILTTTNANGSSTKTSSLVIANLLPGTPTNVGLSFSATSLTCSWTPVQNAITYSLTIYQSPSIFYQSFSGLTVPFYVFSPITIDGNYYYATVQAINSSGGSLLGTSPLTLSSLSPSVTASVVIQLLGSNTLCIWTAAANATSYTVNFYSVGTPVTTGGTLIETDTTSAITQASSVILINGTYVYATVTSLNQYNTALSAITSLSAAGPIANPPQPPTTVTMSISGINTQATWPAATNATSYTVTFYQTNTQTPVGGSLVQTATTASLTQTTSTLLLNGFYYYAAVQSINAYGSSAITFASNQLTQIANPPQPPTSLTIVVAGFNLLCSWTAGTNASTYTVVFYQSDTNVTSGGSVFQTIANITSINQLSSIILVNTKYYYATVTSVNAFGSSATITTPTTSGQIITEPPGPVSSVSIAWVGINLQATWSSGVNASTYTVNFYRVSLPITTSGTLIETDTGQAGLSQTSSTLLINGYYYYCTVTSVNPYGSANPVTSSVPTGIIGNPPLPVTNVAMSFSIVGGVTNTITSAWTAGFNATNYNISYYETTSSVASGGTFVLTHTNVMTPTDTLISNLKGGYYYYAVVTSVNGFGSSSSVTSVTAAQVAVAASPVTNLSITLNGVYATTSWTSSINTLTYTVQYYQVATQTTTGGTLFETDTLVAGTTNTSTKVLVNEYYYYATVTSVNAYANSSPVTSSSTTILVQVAPLPTASVSVSFAGTQVTASWPVSVNTNTYTVLFYQNASATTTGGTLFQTFTGVTGTSQLTTNTLLNGYYYYATVQSLGTYGNSTVVTSSTTTVAITGIAPSPATNVSISMSGYYAVCTWTAAIYNAVTYTVTFYYNSSASTSGGTVFETDTLIAGTTKTSVSIVPNGYYIYATVTSVNPYSTVTVPSATTTSLNQFATTNPSSITLAMLGINIQVSWAAATYATSYTVVLYNNTTTNSTTGGTVIETDTGVTGTSITTTASLTNAYYYYATVQAINAYSSSSIIVSPSAIQAVLYVQNLTLSISNSTGIATLGWTAISGATYTYVLYSATGNNYTSGALYTYGTGSSASLTINTYLAAYYYFTVIATISGSSTILATSSIVQSTYVYTVTSATTFNYTTGVYQYYTVGSSTQITVYMWGGGGAGNFAAAGGAGGYLTGSLAVTPGETLQVVVGLGGVLSAAAGTDAQGGGGASVGGNSAQGGGRSAIKRNISSVYTEIVTVGGGGGSGYYGNPGGAGSYTTQGHRGGDQSLTYVYNTIQAGGGAATRGGQGSYGNTVSDGTQYKGGDVLYGYGNPNGGGGGGGYWGGGGGHSGNGGTGEGGPGGGGSAYVANLTNVSGADSSDGVSAPGTGSSYYTTGIAIGGNITTYTGGNGLVVITQPVAVTTGVTNAYIVTANNVATMTWSAYGSATGYTWILVQSANTNFTGTVLATGTVGSSTLSATYTGLTLNNYYFFGVYASLSSGTSLYGSSPLSLYNNGVPTGGSISLAAFTNLTGGSVTITGLAMNATGYIFYISTTTSIANAIYTSPGSTTSSTFNYTGANQTFTVPSNISSINVSLSGAGGGAATIWGQIGGAGGLVSGTLAVTPGQILTVLVGGLGGTGTSTQDGIGGYNGGGTGYTSSTNGWYVGGGGGWSGILNQAKTIAYCIAGGGGGAGDNGTGGLGGGLTGANATNGNATGGTQSSGGTNGNGTIVGGLWSSSTNGASSGTGDYVGGGGGGGYYGGGAINNLARNVTGGGGGSSYVANLTGTVVNTQGGGAAASTNGQVLISYNSSSNQYTLNQTIAFTVALSVNTVYYAILVPSNSFGNGTAVVSASQTTPATPTGGSIVLNSGLSTTSGSVTITAASNATNYTVYISTTTSSANSVYSFTTTTTGSAVAFTPSPSLSGNTTYYAVLLPSNAYGNGTYSYSSGVATPAALYSYSGTLTFTPAGATGQNGPTLSQCTTAYSSFGSWVNNTAYFNMTQAGYQRWTVPATRNYTIVCAGANGGGGGAGATLTFTASLTQGHIINIVVGQSGLVTNDGCTYSHGGGGGGSFVYNTSTSTLLAAAGGGGGTAPAGGSTAGNPTSTNGNSGSGTSNPGAAGSGGGGGGAGQASVCGNYGGGGGGGYTGNGGTPSSSASYGGIGGTSYTNGAVGGSGSSSTYVANGGFGGGGQGGQYPGGGGGGYSGGGGGTFSSCACASEAGGGGGGSYCYVGTSSTGTNAANGYVSIT
jgi:hypothetical protein